jgi:hypothetical protein
MWGLWWAKRHWGRFSPSTPVSPANHSTNFSIIIIPWGWHNRPISGRSAEWTQLDSTPHYTNLKKNVNCWIEALTAVVMKWLIGKPACFHAGILLGLFDPKDGGDMFVRNFGYFQWITWRYIPEDNALCILCFRDHTSEQMENCYCLCRDFQNSKNKFLRTSVFMKSDTHYSFLKALSGV